VRLHCYELPAVQTPRSPANFTLVLAAIGMAAAVGAIGCAARARPPQDVSDAQRPRATSDSTRAYGWVAMGAGGSATLLAVGTSILMMHDKSVRDGNCNADKVCALAGFNANEDLKYTAGWNVGAWIAAAAGLGVGSVLILSTSDGAGGRSDVTVKPIGSGVGLGVGSTF
jgi:hypothetical protein